MGVLDFSSSKLLINDEIAFILRIHGVKSVVSGSYLVNGDIAKSLLELKSSVSSSKIKIKEFMQNREEFPIVNGDCSVEDILIKIEEYDLGFVCVEDMNMKFLGIISMADIRKGMLKDFIQFQNLKAQYGILLSVFLLSGLIFLSKNPFK